MNEDLIALERELAHRLDLMGADHDEIDRYRRLFRDTVDSRTGDLPCPGCFHRDFDHPGKLIAQHADANDAERVLCLRCKRSFAVPKAH